MTTDRPAGSYLTDLQREIYGEGADRELPLSFADLEALAAERMDPEVYDFVAGGAGFEDTVAENRRAFGRWRILPRVLRDASRRETTVRLLGHEWPAPVLLAPTGKQSIVDAEGELATARAAASLDLPLTLNMSSSVPLEDIADEMGRTPFWFQLTWSRDWAFTESIVDRVERAGYGALVITVDAPLTGWRTRSLHQAHAFMSGGRPRANYFTDPVFRDALDDPPEDDPEAAFEHLHRIFSDVTLTWDDLSFVRERTDLPIVLKGVLHPDDARQAIAHGADAVVVSNHGGRQLDGAVGALDALPGVAAAVDGERPVLMDSGVRSGADAFKALALGATAVSFGRPYLYGLALAGERGVREVLQNLLAELDLTLALSGFDSVADVDRSALVERPR